MRVSGLLATLEETCAEGSGNSALVVTLLTSLSETLMLSSCLDSPIFLFSLFIEVCIWVARVMFLSVSEAALRLLGYRTAIRSPVFADHTGRCRN